MLEEAAPAPRRPCANAETRARDLPPRARGGFASPRVAPPLTCVLAGASRRMRPPRDLQRARAARSSARTPWRSSPSAASGIRLFALARRATSTPRRTASMPRRRSSRVWPAVPTSWSRSCPDPSGSRVTEPSAPSSDLSGSRERARLILGVGPSAAPRCTPRAHSNRLRTDALDARSTPAPRRSPRGMLARLGATPTRARTARRRNDLRCRLRTDAFDAIALDACAATKSSRACSLASETPTRARPARGSERSPTPRSTLSCAERTRGESARSRPPAGRPRR